MKKSYFLKKKISAIAASIGLFFVKSTIRFYKLVFTKRTLLFVTNEKIRSVTLGPISQACLFLFFAWVGNLFMQSLRYDAVISAKSDEISKLKSVNSYFEEEFSNVNDKLRKINEYLSSVSGGIHKVNVIDQNNYKEPKNFKEDDLSRRDKHTLNEIKRAESQLAMVQSVTQARIKKIESAIAITGLNIKKIPSKDLAQKRFIAPVHHSNSNIAQGGPLGEDKSLENALTVASSAISQEDSLERHFEKIKFTSDMDYLMVLERLAHVMPLSKPMQNYYISSGFGARTDPLTHRAAIHQGLDFVGASHERIISPSRGKVILAGQFSDYGNAVVIDHGYGITTRYGHLSAVKVKEGQIVKKGDVIALQGSTGRSTGQHLHYEVRYRNVPLNPRRFLEAGEALFNNERSRKYANS